MRTFLTVLAYVALVTALLAPSVVRATTDVGTNQPAPGAVVADGMRTDR